VLGIKCNNRNDFASHPAACHGANRAQAVKAYQSAFAAGHAASYPAGYKKGFDFALYGETD